MNINRNISKVTSKSVQIKFDLFPLYMSLVQQREREGERDVHLYVYVVHVQVHVLVRTWYCYIIYVCMHEYNLSVYRLRRITFTWYSGGNCSFLKIIYQSFTYLHECMCVCRCTSWGYISSLTVQLAIRNSVKLCGFSLFLLLCLSVSVPFLCNSNWLHSKTEQQQTNRMNSIQLHPPPPLTPPLTPLLSLAVLFQLEMIFQ